MKSRKPWKVRCYADRIRETEELLEIAASDRTTAPEMERVLCACGRHVLAIEMADVSGVAEIPGNHRCGACRGQAFRSGAISESEYLRQQGAPTATVAAMAAAERRRFEGERAKR